MGFAGGVAAELLQWYHIRRDLHRGVPEWAKSLLYWTVTVGMIAFGGLLVFAYQASDGVELNLILAFNIGASAPLILSSLTRQVPLIDHGKVD